MQRAELWPLFPYRFGTTKQSTEHRTLGTTNSCPSSSLRQKLHCCGWFVLERERLRPLQASRPSSLHQRNAAGGTQACQSPRTRLMLSVHAIGAKWGWWGWSTHACARSCCVKHLFLDLALSSRLSRNLAVLSWTELQTSCPCNGCRQKGNKILAEPPPHRNALTLKRCEGYE